MRLRRFSFPFSAVALGADGASLLLDGRPQFRHRLQGRHAHGDAGASPGQADVGQIRQTADGFGFGEVEVQEFGTAGDVSLRFAIQEGGEAGAERRRADRRRDTFGDDTSSAASRRSARASRASSCSPAPSASSSRSSRCCSISGSASSGELALGADHRHPARHRAHDRLLRHHAASSST